MTLYFAYDFLAYSISIHTTRVGGDAIKDRLIRQKQISIHTTRVGGDFYLLGDGLSSSISIHTTRVGGDNFFNIVCACVKYFNPHHPCGWWPNCLTFHFRQVQFQSTPPVWVVTTLKKGKTVQVIISIHTTRVGGDSIISFFYSHAFEFQSTPPVWVVTLDNAT